jgi:hypothetical protein
MRLGRLRLNEGIWIGPVRLGASIPLSRRGRPYVSVGGFTGRTYTSVSARVERGQHRSQRRQRLTLGSLLLKGLERRR